MTYYERTTDAKRWQRFMWSLFCPSELKNSMTLFGIDEIVQDYKKKFYDIT